MQHIIKVKNNVRLKGLTPGLAWILFSLDAFLCTGVEYAPEEVWITSLNDGGHGVDSRHYKNEAMDVRSINFKDRDSKEKFRAAFEFYLCHRHPTIVSGSGNLFRVLLEERIVENGILKKEEHFHCQVSKGHTFP